MAKKPHPDPPAALTHSEIQDAIEASGYPIEIELLRELREARVQSALGVRYEVAPKEYKEIDVSAHFYPKPEVEEIETIFTLLVQVKRPPIDSAFVGVMGSQMKGPAQLSHRLRLTGSVTDDDLGALPEVHALLRSTEQPFYNCLQPFSSLPQCAHWAIARRKKDGTGVFASGDEHYFEDFSSLVKAREMLAIDGEKDRLRRPAPVGAFMGAVVLCLVVDAPCLYIYNPVTKLLGKMPALSIFQSFDTENGPRNAFIDCVSRDVFKEHIERCSATADALGALTVSRRDDVLGIAKLLRERAEVEYLESISRRNFSR
jgi:hypothetical protein